MVDKVFAIPCKRALASKDPHSLVDTPADGQTMGEIMFRAILS
jgi:hypothetical protein